MAEAEVLGLQKKAKINLKQNEVNINDTDTKLSVIGFCRTTKTVVVPKRWPSLPYQLRQNLRLKRIPRVLAPRTCAKRI